MPSASSKKKPANGAAQVRKYLAALPAAARKDLTHVRNAIRAAAPGGEDVISYGIPAIRWNGRVLIWYAAWKEHTSMYPFGDEILRANKVHDYATSSKGTIRFPLTKPPSSALVKKLVKARMAQIEKGGR